MREEEEEGEGEEEGCLVSPDSIYRLFCSFWRHHEYLTRWQRHTDHTWATTPSSSQSSSQSVPCSSLLALRKSASLWNHITQSTIILIWYDFNCSIIGKYNWQGWRESQFQFRSWQIEFSEAPSLSTSTASTINQKSTDFLSFSGGIITSYNIRECLFLNRSLCIEFLSIQNMRPNLLCINIPRISIFWILGIIYLPSHLRNNTDGMKLEAAREITASQTVSSDLVIVLNIHNLYLVSPHLTTSCRVESNWFEGEK